MRLLFCTALLAAFALTGCDAVAPDVTATPSANLDEFECPYPNGVYPGLPAKWYPGCEPEP